MHFEKPEVEFVALSPEIVTAGSQKCDENTIYRCETGIQKTSGVQICGCDDHVYENNLAECPDDWY